MPLMDPIEISVPAGHGVKTEEKGTIVRVVGNSVAYVKLPSGNAFAFSPEDIEAYAGQTLKSIGVREGTPVLVLPDTVGKSRISVRFKR